MNFKNVIKCDSILISLVKFFHVIGEHPMPILAHIVHHVCHIGLPQPLQFICPLKLHPHVFVCPQHAEKLAAISFGGAAGRNWLLLRVGLQKVWLGVPQVVLEKILVEG